MKVIELLIEHNKYSLNRPFSYVYFGDKKIDSGYRVLVDFNHQELVGYVTKVFESNKTVSELENELGFEINEIKDVLDNTPLLSEELMELADEVADYYLASKISVLQTMLPPSLSPRRSSLKAPKIAYDQYIKIKKYDEDDLTSKQIELLRLIHQNQPVLKREIKQVSILEKLLAKELVEIVKVEKRRLEIPDYEAPIIPPLTK